MGLEPGTLELQGQHSNHSANEKTLLFFNVNLPSCSKSLHSWGSGSIVHYLWSNVHECGAFRGRYGSERLLRLKTRWTDHHIPPFYFAKGLNISYTNTSLVKFISAKKLAFTTFCSRANDISLFYELSFTKEPTETVNV